MEEKYGAYYRSLDTEALRGVCRAQEGLGALPQAYPFLDGIFRISPTDEIAVAARAPLPSSEQRPVVVGTKNTHPQMYFAVFAYVCFRCTAIQSQTG